MAPPTALKAEPPTGQRTPALFRTLIHAVRRVGSAIHAGAVAVLGGILLGTVFLVLVIPTAFVLRLVRRVQPQAHDLHQASYWRRREVADISFDRMA